MMDMKLNAERIRALREQRAWSQEHLAMVAGLSTRTLQRIEAGSAATQETCLALAAALEVTVDDLTGAATVDGSRDRPSTGALATGLPSWVVMAMLFVLLVVWFGYTIGKDAALRDNRAEAVCEQDATDCR
jgi:transcriptional regulator with XRE-family HTH domain